MPNPLFNSIGQTGPAGNLNNMIKAFQQFKSSFEGDPQQQIQSLLDSGKMSQDQYNQLAQMANSLMHILK